MAHLTRPAEISGVSAGSFPETAAGNRAYCLLRSLVKYFSTREDKFCISKWLCNIFYLFSCVVIHGL